MATVNADLENLYQQQDSVSSGASSKPNTPPPSYGEIPGVVPFNQGSARGPPPTYEEANNPNAAPPTYESLFGQMREVRKNSSGPLDFLKKILILILGTLGCTVILGVTVVVPISMIIVGSVYLRDCPAEPHIPVYLIVGGAFGALKNAMNFWSRCKRNEGEEDERRLRQSPADTVINCFLFAWFITGCVWVYRIYQPEYEDTTSILYCNKNLYMFSFWLITTAYIVLGIVTGCLCCISIASLTIQPLRFNPIR